MASPSQSIITPTSLQKSPQGSSSSTYVSLETPVVMMNVVADSPALKTFMREVTLIPHVTVPSALAVSSPTLGAGKR